MGYLYIEANSFKLLSEDGNIGIRFAHHHSERAEKVAGQLCSTYEEGGKLS
jgi:hypothetical protein